MKRIFLSLMIILSMFLSGCSANKAEELFETAQLEELQSNPEHARQLYAEILAKYPKSEYVQDAKNRLAALDKK